jgi:DNA polymerase-1
MVRIYRDMEKRGFSSGMIMQVHDELVFEVAEDEVGSAVELIKEGMEGVASLKVPLKVGVSWGDNWDEAH